MRRRRPFTALAVCLAVLAASPAPAPAQAPADSGVGELWEEYPLEEGRRLPEEAGTASPSQQQGEAPRAATPTPTPAGPPARPRVAGDEGGAEGASSSAMLIALGIALLVLVDVAIFLRVRSARRRRRRETSYPVWGQSSNVYAVGATERDGIGAFQGFVYAMASGSGPESDRMLCVHDPSRDEPIWVRRSEVASLSADGLETPAVDFRQTPTADFRRPALPATHEPMPPAPPETRPPAPSEVKAAPPPEVSAGANPEAGSDDGLERRWQEARRRAAARRKAIGH